MKHQYDFTNLLVYLKIRGWFRRRCKLLEARYMATYNRPVRILFCRKHRALVSRRQTGHPLNGMTMKRPTYVSAFCGTPKCIYKGTCNNCIHNINIEKFSL